MHARSPQRRLGIPFAFLLGLSFSLPVLIAELIIPHIGNGWTRLARRGISSTRAWRRSENLGGGS